MGYASTFGGNVQQVFPSVDVEKIEWMSSESPAAIPCVPSFWVFLFKDMVEPRRSQTASICTPTPERK